MAAVKKKRKIIQISLPWALCDDGSLWLWNAEGERWERFGTRKVEESE